MNGMRLSGLLACVLVFATWLCAGRLVIAAEADAAEQADEWVIVLTDPRASRRKGWSSGAAYAGNYRYEDDPKLKRLAAEVAEEYEVVVTDQWPVLALNVHCVVVRIGRDEAAVLDALRVDKRVEWVQPLNTFETLSNGSGGSAIDRPGDPYRHLQTSLELLNVAPLQAEFDGDGIHIALVDSGVEPDHPDLQHAIVESIDFVGKGRMSEQHGTGIAGVMIAASGNDEGIAGIAPGARLHAYRACWEVPEGGARCNSLTLSRALDYVAFHSADIVNLSLTGPEDPLLDRLVARIVAQGAVVVAAYDTRRHADGRFPSPRPGVVMARDGSRIAEASSDVLDAPGRDVLTAQPGHSYDFMNGASLAAAHVTAVLALMLEANPDAAHDDPIASLSSSVRRAGAGSSIDACEAVRYAGGTPHCPRSQARE